MKNASKLGFGGAVIIVAIMGCAPWGPQYACPSSPMPACGDGFDEQGLCMDCLKSDPHDCEVCDKRGSCRAPDDAEAQCHEREAKK